LAVTRWNGGGEGGGGGEGKGAGVGALCRLRCGEQTWEATTLAQILQYARENGKKGLQIQRYKGLGEMNPEQLWETTMDPARRTLLKVMIEDAVEADSIFTLLMGDEVEPRRAFIEQHAKQVTNLDI
ncbi:MAG: hypothetical protein N2595_01310, partial [bacterium]|nr:hypothetical protein [bacterium]